MNMTLTSHDRVVVLMLYSCSKKITTAEDFDGAKIKGICNAKVLRERIQKMQFKCVCLF